MLVSCTAAAAATPGPPRCIDVIGLRAKTVEGHCLGDGRVGGPCQFSSICGRCAASGSAACRCQWLASPRSCGGDYWGSLAGSLGRAERWRIVWNLRLISCASDSLLDMTFGYTAQCYCVLLYWLAAATSLETREQRRIRSGRERFYFSAPFGAVRRSNQYKNSSRAQNIKALTSCGQHRMYGFLLRGSLGGRLREI